MPNKNKINRLIKSSQKIILNCCLKNGAIVAANPCEPCYPKEANNYYYVWPRDASFACLAMDLLGIKGPQEKYFDWLMGMAEDWEKTGLFYGRYKTNGKLAGSGFQPDQTGNALMAVWHHFKDKKEATLKYKRLITRSADGLCKIWDKNRFSLVASDLWEEKRTYPDLQENFMYSLGACIKGLECANDLFAHKKYAQTAQQMKKVLLKNAEKEKHFFRSFGKINDKKIDASLLGLAWPFEITTAKNPLFQNTLKLIEDKLVANYEIRRYENDRYDGWMYADKPRMKGAGFWPLLNFWMSIALSQAGQKNKAHAYFHQALKRIKGDCIPEQIFDNRLQKSVSPLCWSHAMFIVAAKELGYL